MGLKRGITFSAPIFQGRKSYLPEAQVLEWFIQIAMAVQHCHDRKVSSVSSRIPARMPTLGGRTLTACRPRHRAHLGASSRLKNSKHLSDKKWGCQAGRFWHISSAQWAHGNGVNYCRCGCRPQAYKQNKTGARSDETRLLVKGLLMPGRA